MKHGLLYGSHELTIDEKNRLLIPSEIRKQLSPDGESEKLFLIVGVNRKIWAYAEQAYEALCEKQISELSPGEDELMFDQMNFASVSRVEWDKQGRILIPERTLNRTGTDKEVTLIGARDHLEVWNRSDWDAFETQLDQRRAEIAKKARQARKGDVRPLGQQPQ